MRINRKRLIKWGAVISILGSAGLMRSSYERKTLTVEKYVVQNQKIDRNLRFVFLSDLHGNRFGEKNETLIAEIFCQKPDFILIGGDMIVSKPGRKMDFSAFEEILSAVDGKIPVYYMEGNHEQRVELEACRYPYWKENLEELLKKYHVHKLIDKTVSLSDHVTLSGLVIEKEYYKKLNRRPLSNDYVDKHLGEWDKKDFHIVMAHTPQYMKEYWKAGADLVLSGHYHGGTVVLPFLGALMSPQFTFFPPFSRGIYEDASKEKSGIVSSGLGTHSVNIRIMNKPQLVCIRLEKE